jgi:hypothetical protein
MDTPILLDEIRVAALLSVRPCQVRRMVRLGLLPARLLPHGEARFLPSEIVRWSRGLRRLPVERGEREAATEPRR